MNGCGESCFKVKGERQVESREYVWLSETTGLSGLMCVSGPMQTFRQRLIPQFVDALASVGFRLEILEINWYRMTI